MKRILVFTLDEDIFAIDVGSAVEVLRWRPVSHVPELPDFVSGVVDVRGNMVPVIEMRQRMGMPKFTGLTKRRLLLVRSSLGVIAFAVDDVKAIERIDSSMIKKPPMVFRGIKKRFLDGLYKTERAMYIILNMEQILTSEENIILERAYQAQKDLGE